MNPNKIRLCPICKENYTGYPAISRKDNKTEICPTCGVRESFEAFLKYKESKDGQMEDNRSDTE